MSINQTNFKIYIFTEIYNSDIMKKNIFLLIYTVIIFASFSCSSNAQQANDGKKNDTVVNNTSNYSDDTNSIFWEISGNGIENPSYLFGTIHLIPEEKYFFPKYMENAVNSCKTLALEVDIINMPLTDKISMAKRIMMPKDFQIKDYMTAEEYHKYKSLIIDTLGIKERKFNQMLKVKPLFSSAVLINELVENPVAYEEKLGDIAKKNKMNIIGLETMEYQLSIFEKVSLEDQVKEVFIKGAEGNPIEEYNKLIDSYLSQNIDTLAALSEDETEIENFKEDFLINRNKNWVPIISEQVKKEATFIAVGAAHLPGESGVINLLRKDGFTVRAIKE